MWLSGVATTSQPGQTASSGGTLQTSGTRARCSGRFERPCGETFGGRFCFSRFDVPPSLAADSRLRRNVVSLGGCAPRAAASCRVRSVLRSRIFSTSATVDAMSSSNARFAIIASRNARTTTASGATCEVIGEDASARATHRGQASARRNSCEDARPGRFFYEGVVSVEPLRWSATRAALDPDALAAENGPSPSRRPRKSKRRRVCPCTRIMRSAALPRKDAPSCTGYRKRAPDLTEPERKKGEGSLLGLPSPIVYCRLSSLQKATSSTFRHVSNQGHPHPSLLPAAPAGLGPLM